MLKNIAPVRNPYYPRIRIENFAGLNNTDAPNKINDSQFCALINFDIDRKGVLAKRQGTKKIVDAGNDPILSMGAFKKSDGTKKILYVYTTYWKAWNGSSSATLSSTLTTGLRMNMVAANDKVYGFNGTDSVQVYDFSTNTPNASIPKGPAAVWWNQRMYVQDPTNKDKWYYSSLDDPETFDTVNDYFYVGLNDDDKVQNVAVVAGGLLFVKTDSLYLLNGSPEYRGSLAKIADGVGAVSPWAVVSFNGVCFFLGFDDVYACNGSDPISIGRDISTEITQNTLEPQRATSAACVFNKELYISVSYADMIWTTSAPAYKNYIFKYNLDRKAWTTYSGWQANCFAVSDIEDTDEYELYYGDSNIGKIWKTRYGTQDDNDGTTPVKVKCLLATKNFNFGALELTKKIRKYFFSAKDVSVDVSAVVSAVWDVRGVYTPFDGRIDSKLFPLYVAGKDTWDNLVWAWDDGVAKWETQSGRVEKFFRSSQKGKHVMLTYLSQDNTVGEEIYGMAIIYKVKQRLK